MGIKTSQSSAASIYPQSFKLDWYPFIIHLQISCPRDIGSSQRPFSVRSPLVRGHCAQTHTWQGIICRCSRGQQAIWASAQAQHVLATQWMCLVLSFFKWSFWEKKHMFLHVRKKKNRDTRNEQDAGPKWMHPEEDCLLYSWNKQKQTNLSKVGSTTPLTQRFNHPTKTI